MPVDPKTFFNLDHNHTLDQLKNARNTKLNLIASSNMSFNDKQAFSEQVIRLYKKAKKDLAANLEQNQLSLQSQANTNLHSNTHSLFSPFSDLNSSFMSSSNIFNRMMQNMQHFENSLRMNSGFDVNSNNNFNNSNLNQNSNGITSRSRVMSQSKSYSQRTLADGTKIVIEVTKTNNNGQTNQVVKTYKVMPNGQLQQIDFNQEEI